MTSARFQAQPCVPGEWDEVLQILYHHVQEPDKRQCVQQTLASQSSGQVNLAGLLVCGFACLQLQVRSSMSVGQPLVTAYNACMTAFIKQQLLGFANPPGTSTCCFLREGD